MAEKKSSKNPQKLHFSKREAIDFGFETAKKNILYFISVFVVIIVVNGILGFFQVATGEEGLLFVILQIVRMIVGVIVSMGIVHITLKFVDKKKPQLSDLLYTKSFIDYLLVTIVRSFIVMVGFVFFIIPGIIFSIKLQFANYLVVDKKMGVVDALNKSWDMTKGIKWNLFLFWVILFFINLLGLLAFVVGLLITVPLSMVATAYVYRKVLDQAKV